MGGGRSSRNLSLRGVAMTVENHNTAERSAFHPRLDPQVLDSCDVDVPLADWSAFLAGFTDQHEGWLVTVVVISGSKEVIKAGPSRLKEVALIQLGGRADIRISVGGPGPDVIHEVINPVRLVFQRDARGAHEGLEITAADRSVTALRFRVAALPETLDGVLPEAVTKAGR